MHEVVHATKSPNFPEPLFIHRASVAEAEIFFTKRFAGARAIADANGSLFEAFGLNRGTMLQLLGPRALWRGLVALLKGNFVGRPTGNETQMPGAFLTRERDILWEHRARHAGDQPDLDEMMKSLDAASEA